MKRYDIDHYDHSTYEDEAGDWVKYEDVASAIKTAVEQEREACAARLDESAAFLLSGKRTNQVDRHTADVLGRHASSIRARGQS